ncbi:hypothetical protein, partial [Streptomyces galilaeus]|uniref:hypothetical protein n=1 Tax=Streptomyces galilaeus TaxID=33899 RepID=UPI0038F5E83C
RGEKVVREIIHPALVACGLEMSTFLMTEDGKLIEGLTAMIEQSAGVVGVSIGYRVNVFIEMGIALALRKACIMISDHPEGFG